MSLLRKQRQNKELINQKDVLESALTVLFLRRWAYPLLDHLWYML